MADQVFPPTFGWGTTSSSTGSEGAAPRADWYAWEAEGRAPRSGDGNGWATNFEDDIALLRSLGTNSIRITVEWARIEPEAGGIDGEAVDRYRRMLEAARKAGLAPWITLHHGSLPGWFADDAHGFRDERARGYFWPRHVDRCAEWFEDVVAGWVAIDDPTGWALRGHLWGARPPGRHDPLFARDALIGAIEANHAAWKLLRSGSAPTMCVIAVQEPHVERTADETTHPDVAAWAYLGALQHGVLDLPTIGSLEMPHLVESFEYLGIAHIAEERGAVGAGPSGPSERGAGPSGPSERGVRRGEPARLAECVYRVADGRDRRPIVIAANGIATDDEDARDEYLRGVVEQLRLLRIDGVDVAGYFHHTGIDGYEWSDGFARPRGLVNRARSLKPAGDFLQQFVRN
jgi:beta-glucosidase